MTKQSEIECGVLWRFNASFAHLEVFEQEHVYMCNKQGSYVHNACVLQCHICICSAQLS